MTWRSWLARLISRNESAPPYEQNPAIDAVRALRDMAALERALSSESVLTRIAALQALSGMAEPAALGLVTGASQDSWRAVRIAAAESRTRLMGGGVIIADVGTIPADALASRHRAVAALTAELFAHYVSGLRDSDVVIRIAAAEVLGETGAEEAAAPLVKALADPDMAVVSQASESLVRLGEVAVPSLREVSRDANKMVRDMAAWCLQQIG